MSISPYFGYKSKILIPVISVSCLAVVIILALLKGYHLKNKEEILFRYNYQVAQTLIQKTNLFILPTKYSVEKGSALISDHIISISESEKLQQYLLSSLIPNPYLNAVYIGDKNGNFMMSKRISDNKIEEKMVRVNGNRKTETIIIRDESGREIKKEIIENATFDPRTRPWYTEAIRATSLPYWTDVYIFFTEKKLGITISNPIIQNNVLQGVIGADISMEQLNSTLQDIRIDPKSHIIILNDKNQIVASKQILDAKEETRSKHVMELSEDNLIKKAFIAHIKVKKSKVEVPDKELWVSTLVQFPNSFSKNWKILIISPTEGALKIILPIKKIIAILILTLIAYVGIAYRCEYIDKHSKK